MLDICCTNNVNLRLWLSVSLMFEHSVAHCISNIALVLCFRICVGLSNNMPVVINPFKPSGAKWLHYKVFKAILV